MHRINSNCILGFFKAWEIVPVFLDACGILDVPIDVFIKCFECVGRDESYDLIEVLTSKLKSELDRKLDKDVVDKIQRIAQLYPHLAKYITGSENNSGSETNQNNQQPPTNTIDPTSKNQINLQPGINPNNPKPNPDKPSRKKQVLVGCIILFIVGGLGILIYVEYNEMELQNTEEIKIDDKI